MLEEPHFEVPGYLLSNTYLTLGTLGIRNGATFSFKYHNVQTVIKTKPETERA